MTSFYLSVYIYIYLRLTKAKSRKLTCFVLFCFGNFAAVNYYLLLNFATIFTVLRSHNRSKKKKCDQTTQEAGTRGCKVTLRLKKITIAAQKFMKRSSTG